jgi:hypothetical protein
MAATLVGVRKSVFMAQHYRPAVQLNLSDATNWMLVDWMANVTTISDFISILALAGSASISSTFMETMDETCCSKSPSVLACWPREAGIPCQWSPAGRG